MIVCIRPSPSTREQSRRSSAYCLAKLRHLNHTRPARHQNLMDDWLHALVTMFFSASPLCLSRPKSGRAKSGIESLLGCNESPKWRRQPAGSAPTRLQSTRIRFLRHQLELDIDAYINVSQLLLVNAS